MHHSNSVRLRLVENHELLVILKSLVVGLQGVGRQPLHGQTPGAQHLDGAASGGLAASYGRFGLPAGRSGAASGGLAASCGRFGLPAGRSWTLGPGAWPQLASE